MRQCAVPGCKEKNGALFCAPYLDRERRELWIKQIGFQSRNTSTNEKELIYVCEFHFEKRHITDYDKKRISLSAIPTLNLPHRDDAEKLDKEVEMLERKLNVNRIVKNPERLTVLLHDCQDKIKKTATKRDVLKELSIRIYLNNPNAYRSLLPTLKFLPVNELYKSLIPDLQSIEKDKLFQRLIKLKTNALTEEQKECYISIEEFDLEPNYYYHIQRDSILGLHNVGGLVRPQLATTAIVLTLHGISGKWKQCACIGFINEDLNVWQWIKRATEVILNGLEFNVKALVYRADAKYLNIERQYLMLSQNKIYYICEASSLLKILYYNWMTKGYCYEQKFPSKQHLIEYINLTSNSSLQISPKLSLKDLDPTSLNEVNMTHVKKVFSYDTAAALFMYVKKGDLDKSVEVTANFILDTVNLMNSLNPKVLDSKKLPGYKINSATTHLSYLEIALKKFSNLRYSNEAYKNYAHRQPDVFIEHIKITINSILLWHKDNEKFDRTVIPFCHNTYDYSNFQSILDKVLCEKKHFKRSARTFDLIFRQVVTQDLLKPYNKNALVDLEDTLNYIQNVFTYLVMDGNDKDEISKIVRADYKDFKIGNANAVFDLCNSLLEKAMSTHENCEDLKRFVSEWNKYREDPEVHTQNNSIKDFIDLVLEMEYSFKKTIEKSEVYIQDGKFAKTLHRVFQTIEDRAYPCKCFPAYYMKKLYIRFRIYHMLKRTNKNLRKNSTKNSLELEL